MDKPPSSMRTLPFCESLRQSALCLDRVVIAWALYPALLTVVFPVSSDYLFTCLARFVALILCPWFFGLPSCACRRFSLASGVHLLPTTIRDASMPFAVASGVGANDMIA